MSEIINMNININVNVNDMSDKEIKKNNVSIYRFKFEEDFIIILSNFAKIHQYDNRHDFKDAWKNWVDENIESVNLEVRRLQNLGYDGDILDKMFKSARYYFRKKPVEKTIPKTRRVYMGVQKELLEAMDNHIKNNINDENYKPSEGFSQFCQEYMEVLKEQINLLCKNGFTDSVEIKNKIKKTYKNRYFLMISK